GGRGRARGRRRRGGAAPAARRRRPARARCSRTLRIDAPLSLVWAVLTSPDQIAQWFGQSATFPDGVHAGATGTFGWTDVAAHRAAMADHAEGWERELDELVAHVTTLRRGGGAVANLDAGTITRTVLVGADRPTVWRALTTPAAIEASARPTTRQRPASRSASCADTTRPSAGRSTRCHGPAGPGARHTAAATPPAADCTSPVISRASPATTTAGATGRASYLAASTAPAEGCSTRSSPSGSHSRRSSPGTSPVRVPTITGPSAVSVIPARPPAPQPPNTDSGCSGCSTTPAAPPSQVVHRGLPCAPPDCRPSATTSSPRTAASNHSARTP